MIVDKFELKIWKHKNSKKDILNDSFYKVQSYIELLDIGFHVFSS